MSAVPLLGRRPDDGSISPDYLVASDHVWLGALIDEFRRFAGKPWRELELQLREPLRCPSPAAKRLWASQVLSRLCRDRGRPARRPREVRAQVFSLAAAHPDWGCAVTRAAAARELEISVLELDECLFADLPRERRVAPVADDMSASELALRTNLAIVQAVVRRSHDVEIRLKGHARAIVQTARLCGLICVVQRGVEVGRWEGEAGGPCASELVMSISGPMALFRRTVVYGRALAAIVPQLGWCARYQLEARSSIEGQPVTVLVRSGDPIMPADEPRRFDSKLEKRFAREFSRVAPDWDVIREPEPLDTGHGLIFPDFALEHRRDRRRRWHLEIVGFWTQEYLDKKLADLRAAGHSRLIICVDQQRACDVSDLATGAHVIRFRRRVDPAEVLRIIEADA